MIFARKIPEKIFSRFFWEGGRAPPCSLVSYVATPVITTLAPSVICFRITRYDRASTNQKLTVDFAGIFAQRSN